jgi:hypothetical protein
VPYDINAEALRAAQLFPGEAVVDVLRSAANRWAGESLADTLMDIWRMSDAAVRNYPTGIPMSTFGFPWFRLWVRPFVPNIDALTEAERAYYEPFLLATFNNPARIDLNNDMMWNFLTVQEAGEFKRVIDVSVLPPLAEAIRRCRETLSQLAADAHPRGVFTDLADRLRAGRAYHATMRNTMAWTESVHGYIAAATPEVKTRFRTLCREMVENETANARELLALWNESHVDFMPVSDTGETLHIYGENFGMLLQRKIALMEEHRDDEPYIDPGFMWRMPA